jgi:hypothetical protein
VALVGPNDETVDRITAISNFFAGASIRVGKNINAAFVAGPSFTNGQTLFGIKPSFNAILSEERVVLRAAYLRVYKRGKPPLTGDFVAYTFGFGFRLF